MELDDIYSAFKEGGDIFETLSRKAAERASQAMLHPMQAAGMFGDSVMSSIERLERPRPSVSYPRQAGDEDFNDLLMRRGKKSSTYGNIDTPIPPLENYRPSNRGSLI